jgi:hypothetical protein
MRDIFILNVIWAQGKQKFNTHLLVEIFYSSPSVLVKLKVKQSRFMPWRCLGGEEYSCYSFTTSALDGGEWSASRPGRILALGKGPPVPIGQETGWAPMPAWTQRLEEKFFGFCLGSNLDRPVVQPVVRLVLVLAPNCKQHILSPVKVRKLCYSLAELYVKFVYLNLFRWKGAQGVKVWGPRV